MDTDVIMAYCESLPGVSSDYPFGDEPKCYRVGGRIFAQVFPTGVAGALTILKEDEGIPRETVMPMAVLRCDPMTGDFYRTRYPDHVLRPYHTPAQQQPYANTVLLDGTLSGEVLLEMTGHAYNVILRRLPKKVQREISPEEEA